MQLLGLLSIIIIVACKEDVLIKNKQMKKIFIVPSLILIFFFLAFTSIDISQQQKNLPGDVVGELKAKRVAQLFSDDFERSELGEQWVEHFKKISLHDGVLVINQLPNLHPAIARHEIELQNTIFDFDLHLVQAKRALMVVNGEGHVFHVAFQENKAGLKVSVKDYSNGGVIATGTVLEEKKGKWYEITLVLVNDQLEAIVDGNSVVILKSSGLAAKKTLFQLNGVGQHIEFDNVEVWSVAP